MTERELKEIRKKYGVRNFRRYFLRYYTIKPKLDKTSITKILKHLKIYNYKIRDDLRIEVIGDVEFQGKLNNNLTNLIPKKFYTMKFTRINDELKIDEYGTFYFHNVILKLWKDVLNLLEEI